MKGKQPDLSTKEYILHFSDKLDITTKMMKLSKPDQSYWNGNGAYQKELDELTDAHMKRFGRCDTLNGELIRAINRLAYEYYNNGNCNMYDDDGFFLRFQKLIREYIPSTSRLMDLIRWNTYFESDERYYVELTDRVIHFVLENKDNDIPLNEIEWYDAQK